MAETVLQNVTEVKPFRWTKQSHQAAQLLAENFQTDEEIAAELGMTRQTLSRWHKHPEFAARVQEIVKQIGERMLRYAIAKKERRVKALDDRWQRMQQVIAERAEEMKDEVAGGGTGLLCRTIKSIGSGPAAHEVEEFAVDTGLLKELREHEKQAAQELSQIAGQLDGIDQDLLPVEKIVAVVVKYAKSPRSGIEGERAADAGSIEMPGVAGLLH